MLLDAVLDVALDAVVESPWLAFLWPPWTWNLIVGDADDTAAALAITDMVVPQWKIGRFVQGGHPRGAETAAMTCRLRPLRWPPIAARSIARDPKLLSSSSNTAFAAALRRILST